VGRPRTVCLVPVKDAASELVAYLDSASRVADEVVALDDGSTDDTDAMLKGDPRVSVVLTNPPRVGYRDWDDGENRSRLLDAAGALDPDWVLWLDVDERIAPDDAADLRAFIATDALPGCAYGFQHYRIWDDGYDPNFMWIYRLFSFHRGQTLPIRRLHFSPVPTDIPRERWIRTTIRVQHFGAIDEDHRLAHIAKYEDADPCGEFGRNFGGLAERPTRIETWRPRPPGLPVLVPPESDRADCS
jgi:glycosyltransferase involved in cell wall biosynthesis